jgi:hypothetical protein
MFKVKNCWHGQPVNFDNKTYFLSVFFFSTTRLKFVTKRICLTLHFSFHIINNHSCAKHLHFSSLQSNGQHGWQGCTAHILRLSVPSQLSLGYQPLLSNPPVFLSNCWSLQTWCLGWQSVCLIHQLAQQNMYYGQILLVALNLPLFLPTSRSKVNLFLSAPFKSSIAKLTLCIESFIVSSLIISNFGWFWFRIGHFFIKFCQFKCPLTQCGVLIYSEQLLSIYFHNS